MKTYTEHVTLQTDNRREFTNLTPRVKAAVEKSEVTDGIAVIATLHSNSAILVTDDDPKLLEDIDAWLEKLAAAKDEYKTPLSRESSGGIYLQGLALGGDATVAIVNGKLELGAWRQVFYVELDGGRPKRLVIKILGI